MIPPKHVHRIPCQVRAKFEEDIATTGCFTPSRPASPTMEIKIDPEKVRRSKAARDLARETFSFAKDVVEAAESVVDVARFWEAMLSLVREKAAEASPSIDDWVMTNQEAEDFETEIMPFGENVGQAVREVPISRLIYYNKNGPFSRRIGAYLKSQRGQEKIERET